ncbi:MAG: hypothetical protein RLN79_07780 [Cytophagales bacterium]
MSKVKRIISISLALLMLVSNVGFAMNTHFCGGKAVKTNFTLGLHNLDCGMSEMEYACEKLPTSDEHVKTEQCCENKHQILQLEDCVEFQNSFGNVNPLFVATFIQTIIEQLNLVDDAQSRFAEYSPPLPDKDIQVLFQAFLI